MAYTGTTAAILSNYDEVLKTFYLPAIQEQLNHATPLADLIDKNEEDVSGKNATIECHYGRTRGTGARADGGALPEADYQKFKTCTVPMKYNYGRVTFSGPTIAATRDEKGSYARVIDTEITGVVTDLQKEVNRQLWGCGYGHVARWRSTTDGDTQTVQRRYRNNSAGGDGFASTFGDKYLVEMSSFVPVIVASLSGSGTMTVGGTDMYKSTITFTIDATTGYFSTIDACTDPSTSEVAGTWFVRPASALTVDSSSDAAGLGRLEMMGLRGIVTNQNLDDIAATDGTNTGLLVADPLQGLLVGSYAWWKATVDTHTSGRYAGQRALTLELMQKMFDSVEEKAGVGYGPDLILTSRAIRREYLDIMQADRRNVNTMTLDGGWTALEYNGIPLMVDSDAIDGEMYFLSSQDLAIFRMSDYDWMTKDGAVLSRITGRDAYEAVLFRYAEFGCRRRNSQGALVDLDYTL